MPPWEGRVPKIEERRSGTLSAKSDDLRRSTGLCATSMDWERPLFLIVAGKRGAGIEDQLGGGSRPTREGVRTPNLNVKCKHVRRFGHQTPRGYEMWIGAVNSWFDP